MKIKTVTLISSVMCILIYSCKYKSSSTINTPPTIELPANIIRLDLSIPSSFSATYLYGPSIQCNQTIITGSAKLQCDFSPPLNYQAGDPAIDAIYTTDLAASIADGCIISGIASDTKFVGTPFISGPCMSGTSISCTATGVNPSRSAIITGICP